MSAEIIASINEQIKGTVDRQVYVLEITSIQIEELTAEIQGVLERFQALQMLTINNCGLKSLRNFPRIPSLIRLDLVSNKLTGDSLNYLKPLKYLQTLYLSGNLIKEIDELKPLTSMDNLLQLDLVCNDVVTLPAYREKIFSLFPGLSVLDSLNREAQFNKPSMSESIKRVRSDLFEKVSKPVAAKIKAAIVRTSSILSNLSSNSDGNSNSKKTGHKASSLLPASKKIKKDAPKKSDASGVRAPKATIVPVSGGGKGKSAKSGLIPSGRMSTSAKSGLVFPVGRIKRRLRDTKHFARISKGAGVYMASVLEYLTCEIVELAGNEAKTKGKKRIDPKSIRNSIERDEEIRKLLGSIVIPEGGFEAIYRS